MPDSVQRFTANPLLSPDDISPVIPGAEVACLLNPGAFTWEGKTWLLLRAAERPPQREGYLSLYVYTDETCQDIDLLEFALDDPLLDAVDSRVITYNGIPYLTTLSHLRLVCSEDGRHFRDPGLPPLTGRGGQERYGIEDCRVAAIGDTFYLTYSAVDASGYGVGMISTRDWQLYERHGLIFTTPNKDCALFTQKVNDSYYALNRPSSAILGGHDIWLSRSPDLRYWGEHTCLLRTRPGCWDGQRIGAGAEPILTEEGWLVIYHGADQHSRYCLGAALLDRDRPEQVLARSRKPFMEPVMPYERKGFFGDVVFSNGHIADLGRDLLTLYYGASDTVVCGAEIAVSTILAQLERTL